MIDQLITQKSISLHEWFLKNNKKLSVAESCTGGNLSASIVENSGSSEYFIGGITSYSNECKRDVLGVKQSTLDQYGAVSKETAVEMAQGVMKLLDTDYAVSTTGITGPSGGSAEKPVGTVWIAACSRKNTITFLLQEGDEGRHRNCIKAVLMALELLKQVIEKD
jgi:PncC family amidohydrolase